MARTTTDQGKGDAATLTPSSPAGERRPGLRAAGLAGSRLAAPILARRGGGALARMKAEWAAIAGAEIAAVTWPSALGRGGALRLLAAPARALEVQHRTPLLIERINLFFGRPVVERIALVQGPLPIASAPSRPIISAVAPSEAAALERQLATVEDAELRAALNRLGCAVIGANRRDS
jgi:hypothetical protein